MAPTRQTRGAGGIMTILKSVAAAALVLVVAAAPEALAKNNKAKKQKLCDDDRRAADAYKRFDKNRDGVVARSEFPGDDAEFARLDRNRDGVLTTSSAGPPAPEDLFMNLADKNRYAIPESELHERRRYYQYDRNNDGVVTRSERREHHTS